MSRKYNTRLNIALDPETLRDIDERIDSGEFRSRSEAIQYLVTEDDEGVDDEPSVDDSDDFDFDDDQADDDD